MSESEKSSTRIGWIQLAITVAAMVFVGGGVYTRIDGLAKDLTATTRKLDDKIVADVAEVRRQQQSLDQLAGSVTTMARLQSRDEADIADLKRGRDENRATIASLRVLIEEMKGDVRAIRATVEKGKP